MSFIAKVSCAAGMMKKAFPKFRTEDLFDQDQLRKERIRNKRRNRHFMILFFIIFFADAALTFKHINYKKVLLLEEGGGISM